MSREKYNCILQRLSPFRQNFIDQTGITNLIADCYGFPITTEEMLAVNKRFNKKCIENGLRNYNKSMDAIYVVPIIAKNCVVSEQRMTKTRADAPAYHK